MQAVPIPMSEYLISKSVLFTIRITWLGLSDVCWQHAVSQLTPQSFCLMLKKELGW